MSDELRYERHAEFYRDVYGDRVWREKSVAGFDLLDLIQPGGDFSDQPSNDLVIQRILCRCHFRADYGAGRFSTWSTRGAFIMAPPRTYAAIVIDGHSRHDSLSINWQWLRDRDVAGELPSDGDFGSVHRAMRMDPAMNRLMDGLWAIDLAVDGLDSDTVTAALIDRLAAWSGERQSPPPVSRESLSPAVLRRSIAMLEEVDGDALSLADLAALAGLSPYHFCRAFRAATGLPPHRWRIASRMEQARTLLRERQRSVGDVAAAVGYPDAAYFSRLFRRETGLSPREWQQAWMG